MRTILLFSGGLDSTVLLYDLKAQGDTVRCLLVDYGQAHSMELIYARDRAHGVGVPYENCHVSPIPGSLLTDGKGTKVVPMRNALLLSLGVGRASALGFDAVAIGCNADDSADFPDCRQDFIHAMQTVVTNAGIPVKVQAPYVLMRKSDIVRRGKKLGVPMDQTWSCYSNHGAPCGTCDACKARVRAGLER